MATAARAVATRVSDLRQNEVVVVRPTHGKIRALSSLCMGQDHAVPIHLGSPTRSEACSRRQPACRSGSNHGGDGQPSGLCLPVPRVPHPSPAPKSPPRPRPRCGRR